MRTYVHVACLHARTYGQPDILVGAHGDEHRTPDRSVSLDGRPVDVGVACVDAAGDPVRGINTGANAACGDRATLLGFKLGFLV